jgi:MarR family transcriptional regulator, organic hydroperoxide resistance regulator
LHDLGAVLDDAVHTVLTAYPSILSALRRRQPPGGAGSGRLSEHQAGILDHLDAEAQLTVGELAARLRVTPATASIQLDRLARLRLVVRERDAADARRVRLRLTDAGARVRRLQSLLDPDRVRDALARLEPAELDTIATGLRLLARGAGATGTDSGKPPRTRRSPRR